MKALLFSLLALLVPANATLAQDAQGADATPAASQPPRLIVLLAIDQFIPEQMERLESSFQGGLAQIRKDAARFDNAALPYSSSETGPGHATMSTGCLPRTHGIVGNTMRSREADESIYCVADPTVSTVTSSAVDAPGSVSARNILVPCLGDHLKARYPRAKVFGVSVKDRAAVSLAGHAGDGAFWWDGKRGGFVSSTYYVNGLPEYVKEYNAGWAKEFSGFVWTPIFDPKNPPKGTEKDDRDGEQGFFGQGATFPYPFAGQPGEAPTGSDLTQLAGQVGASPLGDRASLELASSIVIHEQLGADDIPDFLGVSLSAPDKVGHSFGPYSMEVTDTVLRIDRELETFFRLLDERVGKDRWVLALTADHGVLPLPEGEHALVKDPGKHRVGKKELKEARDEMEEDLIDAFGADSHGRALKMEFGRGDVYFDRRDMDRRGIDPAQARFVAAKSLEKESWVETAYTLEQLASQEATQDPYLLYYRNAYSAEYSPDVVVQPKRGTLVGWTKGTTHGSAYAYDRRIPLYFLGGLFSKGGHDGLSGSHDIVPTLLSLVGVKPEGLDGRILSEAFGW